MRARASLAPVSRPPREHGDRCRSCGEAVGEPLVELGATPLANSFLRERDLRAMEPTYPLRLRMCASCGLLQLEDYEAPETIFSEYAYLSSFSDTWLEHCRRFVADAVERFRLGPTSRIVEIASNDGCLLAGFVERGIPALGVEPAANVAAHAERRGVPTRIAFFGRALARELAAERSADLVIANNVLAHVPDLDDFVGGLTILLAPDGTLTIEFPHVERLVADVQFDTIYHEHFSYFTLLSAQRALARHGLAVVDVDELPTHGGSLRVHGRHAARGDAATPAVADLLDRERAAGLDGPEPYRELARNAAAVRRSLMRFVAERRDAGERIAAYGAAAKGNTLLNYCGLGPEDVELCVDRNPLKQGTLLPGSRIPVGAPELLDEVRPDVVLILPWNLRDEVMAQLAHVRGWGGEFAWRTGDGVAVG
jgi:SAM-dependent methyltransferase